ncbi:MAG: AAA family ATPase [Planctomycetes bacterium]|nr:AAA family ATPase [Planctomycetota bacterium]
MAFTIALSGKGGTGKTTFSAFAVRYLAEQIGGGVLAVDADPNSNLGYLLGVEPEQTIADIRESATKIAASLSPGMSKDRELEYRIQQSVLETPKFDLITMGRPEGPKCYCYVNHLLRGFLDKTAADYRFVVIDNEAGMEHLSRRTTNDVDVLMVVAEPTLPAVEAAKRILEMADDLPIIVRRRMFILTRVLPSGVTDRVREKMSELPLEVTAEIPYDKWVCDMMAGGTSVFELPESNSTYRTIWSVIQETIAAVV